MSGQESDSTEISHKHRIPRVPQQPYCIPNPTAQAKATILDSFYR